MAASSKSVLTLGVLAAVAITQGRAITAAGAVAAGAARSVGIAETDAAIGARVPYTALGTALATAGAAIAVGALVEVGTAGKLITRSAGVSVGTALTAAAADGDQIEVLLIPN